MPFYDLSKEQRTNLVVKITNDIFTDLNTLQLKNTMTYFGDKNTYIRKSAYLSIGKIYFTNKNLQSKIIKTLDKLLLLDDFKIPQTVIDAADEIGKKKFETQNLLLKQKHLYSENPKIITLIIALLKNYSNLYDLNFQSLSPLKIE